MNIRGIAGGCSERDIPALLLFPYSDFRMDGRKEGVYEEIQKDFNRYFNLCDHWKCILYWILLCNEESK